MVKKFPQGPSSHTSFLGHFLSVDVPHAAVGAQDEPAAVLVALPLGDHLHADALFDAVGDEQLAERALNAKEVPDTLAKTAPTTD